MFKILIIIRLISVIVNELITKCEKIWCEWSFHTIDNWLDLKKFIF
jgi:hypothetical protein